MNYRPRINCLIPNDVDSTSMWRAVGPLSKLKHHIDCEFTFTTNISWASLSWSDILFVQRPWGKAFHKACQIAVNNKIPIWIDYDDYLLDIPDWNPHKRNFSNQYDQKDFLEMLQMATVITVTTEKLKEKFLNHNENVFIVPNAINDYSFDFQFNPSKNKIINWRGSATHSEDLRSILPQIKEIQDTKKHLDWKWNFIGKDAENLRAFGIHYIYQEMVDPIQYFKLIDDLRPMIQLVPLVNNDFNQAKSNIGWIEGVYSGAVCIAPKYLKEFQRPGVLLYESEADFLTIIETCLQHPEALKDFYKKSFDFISSHLLLSKVNLLRKQIVEQLMDLKNKKG